MIPGVRETPATIDAGFPWIRQTRALSRPPSSRASWTTSSPRSADFAEFTDGQLDLLPVLDDLNRCQLEVVLPAVEQRIDDGALSTGLRNYEEFFQGDGLARGRVAELRRQRLLRADPGGRRAVRRPDPALPEPAGPLHASASQQPLGTRPAKTPKPPYKPNVKCHTQPVPNLSDAAIGGGP